MMRGRGAVDAGQYTEGYRNSRTVSEMGRTRCEAIIHKTCTDVCTQRPEKRNEH